MGNANNPGWAYGYVPAAAEWNDEFGSKADASGQPTAPLSSPYNTNATGATSAVAAFTSIDGAGTTALVPAGTYLIDSNLTLDGDYTLLDGAQFSISNGVTLTLNGTFAAPNNQVFTGSGTVSFGSSPQTPIARAEWWGAGVSNSAAANTSAINAALEAHPNVVLLPGTYQVNLGGAWTDADGSSQPYAILMPPRQGQRFAGAGMYLTTLQLAANQDAHVVLHAPLNLSTLTVGLWLEDMTLDQNGQNQTYVLAANTAYLIMIKDGGMRRVRGINGSVANLVLAKSGRIFTTITNITAANQVTVASAANLHDGNSVTSPNVPTGPIRISAISGTTLTLTGNVGVAVTGTTSSSSPIVTSLSSNQNVKMGMFAYASNIPLGTTAITNASSGSVTLSANPTSNVSGQSIVFSWVMPSEPIICASGCINSNMEYCEAAYSGWSGNTGTSHNFMIDFGENCALIEPRGLDPYCSDCQLYDTNRSGVVGGWTIFDGTGPISIPDLGFAAVRVTSNANAVGDNYSIGHTTNGNISRGLAVEGFQYRFRSVGNGISRTLREGIYFIGNRDSLSIGDNIYDAGLGQSAAYNAMSVVDSVGMTVTGARLSDDNVPPYVAWGVREFTACIAQTGNLSTTSLTIANMPNTTGITAGVVGSSTPMYVFCPSIPAALQPNTQVTAVGSTSVTINKLPLQSVSGEILIFSSYSAGTPAKNIFSGIRGMTGNGTTGLVSLYSGLPSSSTLTGMYLVTGIVSAGSNNAIGDTLTVSGGTFSVAAQAKVVGISSGAVTALMVTLPGVYTVAPTGTLTTTSSNGGATPPSITANFGAPQSGTNSSRVDGCYADIFDSSVTIGTAVVFATGNPLVTLTGTPGTIIREIRGGSPGPCKFLALVQLYLGGGGNIGVIGTISIPAGTAFTLTNTVTNNIAFWYPDETVGITAPPSANVSAVSSGTGTTLTASILASINGPSIINRTGPGANFTDTTDTAANIVAALTGAATNSTAAVQIINASSYLQTIAGGTGVTMTGALDSGNFTVGPGSTRTFTMVVTNASSPAVTIYG